MLILIITHYFLIKEKLIKYVIEILFWKNVITLNRYKQILLLSFYCNRTRLVQKWNRIKLRKSEKSTNKINFKDE